MKSPWKKKKKGGIKRAEANVPASKTWSHLGRHRLTLNIFWVAAAASRRARCQSVRRHNVYLMMWVTGEIGIFISPSQQLSLSLFLSLTDCQEQTCLSLLIRHREKDRERDCLSWYGSIFWQSGREFKLLSSFYEGRYRKIMILGIPSCQNNIARVWKKKKKRKEKADASTSESIVQLDHFNSTLWITLNKLFGVNQMEFVIKTFFFQWEKPLGYSMLIFE